MIIEAKGTQDNIIGRLGENLAIRVEFHVGNVLREHPDAVFTVLHKRPGDEVAYPVSPSWLELDGTKLLWTIQSGDLENVGVGECEVAAYEDEAIIKSTIYRTKILPALDDSGEVPDPWESWVGDVATAAASAIAAQTAAETSAADAAGSVSAVAESAAEAFASASAAQGSATAAAASATQAVEAATGVDRYAQEAAASATAAAGSATDAAGSATAAETAQDAAEDAQEAAEAAQAAAEAASIRQPIIDTTTGNWMVWDAEESEYTDTGIKARPDVIRVQDTQPAGDDAMIWFPETKPAEVQVPTLAEMNTALAAKYEKPAGGIPASDIAAGVIPDVSGLYTKPAGGIPATDMASAVQTSLGKADTAYQKPAGGIPASDIASGVIPDVSGLYTKPAGGIPASDIASGVIPDPEDLIDDTAGDGDTDKVWSADKSADVSNSLNSAINALPQDVQVNGTSVVGQDGIANIPAATSQVIGVTKIGSGLMVSNNTAMINTAPDNVIKAGTNTYAPITPSNQEKSAFFGLAKIAGADEKDSSLSAGVYSENAKSKISDMLNAPVGVSGTTPSITGKSGIRYLCGTVSTLSITPPASGDCEVIFTSGSTATVLTVPNTVKFPGWFNPASLEANKVYDIIITNATYGVVMAWEA